MKLEHVAINVPEPAAMAQWLVDNLGMRIVLATDESPYMHFVSDDAGGMFELYNNPTAPIPDYASMNHFTLHFAFASSDIEADVQRLIEAGATADGEITTTPTGDKLAFLRSPWQVAIQFVQRSKPLI